MGPPCARKNYKLRKKDRNRAGDGRLCRSSGTYGTVPAYGKGKKWPVEKGGSFATHGADIAYKKNLGLIVGWIKKGDTWPAESA